VLSNGKRCPNAALPGSRYCGVPAHQALVNQPAAADEPSEDEEELAEEAAEIEEVEAELEVAAVVEDALEAEEESRDEA
jgi:N utilization substance protein A